MSNRDSLGVGDLLPQDVVDIFAQEKLGKRGRKKRSHSLGRALGWLKGKKRKDAGAKGHRLGLGPALDLALDGHPAGHQGAPKGGQKSAVPKLDDDKTPAPPLFQENVFIEASRPKYLENLHTEALEGLKMMQQEETNNGVEYQDNESTISTMTHTDGEGGGFITDSTIADSTSVVSVQSSVSTRSSRSGLTRQGSTFRPLNSGKKEKTKTRRRHRKTVGGIPQHVQRELGLDRVGWSLAHRLDEEQLYNGETDNSPTTDGPPQAAESQTGASQDITVIQPLNKDQLKRLSATHAGHRDDLALLHSLVPDLSDEQRPQSLAVPWMTTANSLQQELPSPVMSMSPQAAYMSKIIPNAVLPPSIDVVEISRGRSRNSVRTVSKSSLVLSSPAPSRASSRASSSRASTVRSSASRHNPPTMSDSSCWSNSESSETLVSDSSTISSSSTPRQKRSQEGDASAKEDINKASKCTSNGKLIIKGEDVKKDGQFARSLSVIKPKRAPPPPSRSYSLHNKIKRRSRDLAEVRVPSGESSLHSIAASGMENEKNKPGSSPVPSRVIDSPGYNADTSSLDESTGSVSFSFIRSQLQAQKTEEAAKVEAKDASQEKQEPLKEDKRSKIASPSSGYSSQEGACAQLSKPPHSSSPRHKRGIFAKLQRLFPGSSPAASPPPPVTKPEPLENSKPTENLKPDTSVSTTSASPSVRALRELFNIPPPPKVHAPPPPPPEVWSHSERSCELLLGPPAPGNTYAMVRKNPKDRRQQRKSPSASTEGSVKSLVVERKHKNATTTVNGSVHVEEKVQESEVLNAEIHKENNDRLTEQKVDLEGNRKVTEKDEKVRVSDILNGMLVKAVERRGERLTAVRKEEAKKTNMDTLPAISLARIPPSPSPPSAQNPPQPPVVSPESSWPPPPPPVGQSSPDELDFPLPPPPMFSEEGLVMPVAVPPERSIPGGATTSVLSECVRVTTEAEPQKPSTSKGIIHPTLNIPPPPSYSAPPPPLEAVPLTTVKVSLPPIKEVSPPPTPKEFSPPPPKEVSPSPPVKDVSPPPPVKEVSPPPPVKEVSPPPPVKEVSPPPPIASSPLPPPKEFAPPPPPKEVSPPPPPKEVSPPPPPKEVSPPPPPIEVSLPPLKVVSPPPPPKKVSPPPPIEVSPPPPKEVSPPPQPKEVSPPTLPEEVTLPPSEQASPPLPKESSPPLVEEAAPPLVEDVSSTPVTVVSPPTVEEVSPLPPKEISTLSNEGVSPPSSQENAQKSSEEETPVSTFAPPQSIPPPPPLQPAEQEIDLPQENVPSKSETSTISSNSILTPPQSIPPPPPVQEPQVVPPDTATQEASNSPPSEVSVPPPPENSLSTEEAQRLVPSPPSSTENQPPEPTTTPVVQEESTPIVTPSLLQAVKLRSLNSSPEPPKAEEQPEAEVTMRNQEPSNQVPTSSASAEAPQKPIRRSLIMTSPTPTSPPAVVTSQPALPKPQSLVVPPVSSSTALSPTKKSPPAMTATPSMNLQEAIRLRTAARSKGGPGSRLSLQSPTSPIDLHKSPTSTASFIFSKSNKRVVIETKPAPETKATTEKNLEVSSVTKVVSEAETVTKGVKVPPPVAKKPKSKGKEIETSEVTEQTAGQEALQESIKDATEKTNETAGTVDGGTPST